MQTSIHSLYNTALFVVAFIFTWRLIRQAEKFRDASGKSSEAIHRQTEAIHKQTKLLHLDNLRRWYELSKGTDNHSYFDFRWRFETYNTFRIQVYLKRGEILGTCDLWVEGFSNPVDDIEFEYHKPECYIAKVLVINLAEGKKFPFENDDRVFCFHKQGELILSKDLDLQTEQSQYPFHILSSFVQRIDQPQEPSTIDTVRAYPRIKDL